MITQITSNSIREGRSWSRLPMLSERWIETIRGSADFLGLNYYTSRMVEATTEPTGQNPSYDRDFGLKQTVKPEWKPSASDWLYAAPQGLGDILRCFLQICDFNSDENLKICNLLKCVIFRWIKEEYNDPEVFITENGWSDRGEMEDDERISYLHDHLEQVLDVVLDNECNLKGYTG